MRNRTRVAALALGAAVLVGSAVYGMASSTESPSNVVVDTTSLGSSPGRYAEVNGLRMYYEVHGKRSGTPLVLLHGNVSAIGTSFSQLLPGLARNRWVIAVEQQGFGHTADIDRPLRYEQMADDTAELLRQLGIERADFFGYSMGAGVAFNLGLRHPGKVRKLVLATVTYRNDGQHPGVFESIDQIKPDTFFGTPWYEEYQRIAPRPGDFPQLIEKVKDLVHHTPEPSLDAIMAMRAPTLVMIGDSDIVRPEHSVALFRLLGGGVMGDAVGLPNSELAIVPGTTHVSLVKRAELVIPMVDAFLARSV